MRAIVVVFLLAGCVGEPVESPQSANAPELFGIQAPIDAESSSFFMPTRAGLDGNLAAFSFTLGASNVIPYTPCETCNYEVFEFQVLPVAERAEDVLQWGFYLFSPGTLEVARSFTYLSGMDAQVPMNPITVRVYDEDVPEDVVLVVGAVSKTDQQFALAVHINNRSVESGTPSSLTLAEFADLDPSQLPEHASGSGFLIAEYWFYRDLNSEEVGYTDNFVVTEELLGSPGPAGLRQTTWELEIPFGGYSNGLWTYQTAVSRGRWEATGSQHGTLYEEGSVMHRSHFLTALTEIGAVGLPVHRVWGDGPEDAVMRFFVEGATVNEYELAFHSFFGMGLTVEEMTGVSSDVAVIPYYGTVGKVPP